MPIKRILGFNLYNILRFLRYKLKLPKSKSLKRISFNKSFTDALVLGNGPSLAEDRERILKLSKTCDTICVNNFADSDLFIKLRPKICILIDSYFFLKKGVHEDFIHQREKTFQKINDHTDWEMTLLLPPQADVKFFREYIKNTNIHITRLSTVSVDIKNAWARNKVFDTGNFGPFQGNVLIYSIYSAILLGYKNINIFGADLNFHKLVDVNQNTNETEIIYKHFNSKDETERFLKNPAKKEIHTMLEFMELTYLIYKAHYELEQFSNYKGCCIKNLSSYSLIDCYSRS